MALSQAQLSSLRGYVGDTPTDAELDALYDLHQSVEVVAHLVLSQRLQTMQADALRVDLQGDITEDWTENYKALERTVARLAPLARVGAPITTGRLVRPSRR